MSQQKCPRCGTVYSGDAKFCPKDGTPLVEAPAAAPSAPSAARAASAGSTQIRQAI